MSQAIDLMVRPERFELPAYWLSSLASGSYIDVTRVSRGRSTTRSCTPFSSQKLDKLRPAQKLIISRFKGDKRLRQATGFLVLECLRRRFVGDGLRRSPMPAGELFVPRLRIIRS